MNYLHNPYLGLNQDPHLLALRSFEKKKNYRKRGMINNVIALSLNPDISSWRGAS